MRTSRADGIDERASSIEILDASEQAGAARRRALQMLEEMPEGIAG